MSTAEFVEFSRSIRLVGMATVGPAGQPHIAPVHAKLAGTMLRLRIYEDTVRRSDLATNPRVAFTTWRTDGAVAILYGRRARSPAACALRSRERAAARAGSSRSRCISRASTYCARPSASRACPPRPGSDSATWPSSPISATSSLGAALASRPVATRYGCSSLVLPPSPRPTSRFEPASCLAGDASRCRGRDHRLTPRPAKSRIASPRPHGARGLLCSKIGKSAPSLRASKVGVTTT